MSAKSSGHSLFAAASFPKRARRPVAWLGILLVVFNVLAAGMLPAQAAASADAGTGLLVCTSKGMVAVGPGAPPPQGGASSHQDLCAFCLPLMHGGAQPLADCPAVAVRQLPPAGAYAPAALFPAPPARPAGKASPRAPPLA